MNAPHPRELLLELGLRLEVPRHAGPLGSHSVDHTVIQFGRA